jgi:ribosomal protein L14E/L6E/L27E
MKYQERAGKNMSILDKIDDFLLSEVLAKGPKLDQAEIKKLSIIIDKSIDKMNEDFLSQQLYDALSHRIEAIDITSILHQLKDDLKSAAIDSLKNIKLD